MSLSFLFKTFDTVLGNNAVLKYQSIRIEIISKWKTVTSLSQILFQKCVA